MSHLVYGVVKTEQPVNDAMVTIESSLEQPPVVLGPLTLDTAGKGNGTDKTPQKGQAYTFSYWAKYVFDRHC